MKKSRPTKADFVEQLDAIAEKWGIPPIPNATKLTCEQLMAVATLLMTPCQQHHQPDDCERAMLMAEVADKRFDNEQVVDLLDVCAEMFPDTEEMPGTAVAAIHLATALLAIHTGDVGAASTVLRTMGDLLEQSPEPVGALHN